MHQNKIPVTVVTGFLGAGKTTLVNHMLRSLDPATTGVIVNEFGEVGIDGELIYADDKALIEIRNGCVCCTVRSDLVAGVRRMLNQDIKLERLIVETSGLADPGPVLQTFLADADLLEHVVLESVITLVDAVNLHRLAQDDIAREQIAFSDLIVLNKTDAADASQLAASHALIKAINPAALVYPTTNAQVPPDVLMGTRRFSLLNVLELEPGLLTDDHDHEHDGSIGSCSIQTTDAIDPALFSRWINRLVDAQGENLMRTKAILDFHGEQRQFCFHSVHMLMDSRPGKRWPDGIVAQSTFVAIGRDLDYAELRNGFLSCRYQMATAVNF